MASCLRLSAGVAHRRRWRGCGRLSRGGGGAAAARVDEAATAGFDALGRWLAEKEDGDVAEGLQIAYCDMSEPGDDGEVLVRGVVARDGANARSRLLAVPMERALLEGQEGLPAPYAGAPWMLAFGAKLLRERAAGDASEWAPYCRVLPHTPGTPLELRLADAEAALQYAPAAAALRELHGVVHEAAERAPVAGAGAAEWAWAVGVVMSRTLRMRGRRMMLPAVDMLNHGGEARNITVGVARAFWQTDPDAGTVMVLATRDVAPGEQVLFTYGHDRSNDDFFLYYGFVLPGSDYDTFIAFDSVEHAVAWHRAAYPEAGGDEAAARAAAQRALGQASEGEIGEAFPRAPLRAAGDGDAVEFVRAPFRLHHDAIGGAEDVVQVAPELLLRADGLLDARMLAAFGALAPAGTDPHAHSLAALRRRAAELLAAFPTTEQDDVAALAAGGFASYPEELVVRYNREKKRVLRRVLAAVEGAGA